MNVLCECNSLDCEKQVFLMPDEYQRIRQDQDLCVIVEGCCTPAEPGDVDVEQRNGYKIIRMAT